MGRLTDNDKQFGPITYGKASWNAFRIILGSNGGENDDDHDAADHRVKTSLTIYIFGWAFRIYLGQLIKRVTYKVKAQSWDQATIARMGRDWYPYSFSKEYGFSLHEGFLQIFYGLQNDHNHYTHVDEEGFLTYKFSDQNKKYIPVNSRSWSRHLPWTQWRITTYRLYNDKNEVHYEIKDNKGLRGISYYDAKKDCPPVHFVLKDYDGTEVIAKTVIEETVYKLGEGYFKWLSWFIKPRVYRRLDIDFDKETGPEKGSWKGGTMGLSCDATDKNHVQAIKAFCEEEHRSKNGPYRMKFISREVPECLLV